MQIRLDFSVSLKCKSKVCSQPRIQFYDVSTIDYSLHVIKPRMFENVMINKIQSRIQFLECKKFARVLRLVGGFPWELQI